jgi:hypothetical protein
MNKRGGMEVIVMRNFMGRVTHQAVPFRKTNQREKATASQRTRSAEVRIVVGGL